MIIQKNPSGRYEATQRYGHDTLRVEYSAFGDTHYDAFNRLMAKLGYLPEVDMPHPLTGLSEEDLINNF